VVVVAVVAPIVVVGSTSSSISSRLTYISMVYLLHVTRSDGKKKPLTLHMLLYFAMV